AAVVLTTRATAESKGWEVLATLRAVGQVAGPDSSLQAQPANALKKALARQSWGIEELDVIEINEAFAAVVVHSANELGISPDRVNAQGGAIAMGHPIGASGARLVVHAAYALKKGANKAGVSLCGGGGQGEALLMERNSRTEMTDSLLTTRVGRAGIITLNRPNALNALDLDMIRSMTSTLRDWANDDDIFLVIVRGAGERALCAGGDIAELYKDENLGKVF